MIATFHDGTTREFEPGCCLVGQMFTSITITFNDIQNPLFLPWITENAMTRLFPAKNETSTT